MSALFLLLIFYKSFSLREKFESWFNAHQAKLFLLVLLCIIIDTYMYITLFKLV